MQVRSVLASLRFAGLAVAAAMLVATPRPVDAAPQVTLRMYSSLPADDNSAHYAWYAKFKSALDARTKGAVEVNFFPNAQLGKEADAIQQVRLGAIDLMVSGTSIWATIAPEIGVLDLGYLFDGYAQVGKSLDGAAGKTLGNLLEQKSNVRVLGFGFSMGARNVYTRNPVKTPHDLDNVKIRVLPVPNFLATLKAMGVTPIPMPGGEVYSGLQMGVIDGLEHDAATVLASKFYEIAKYCTLTRHIYNPIVVVVNKGSFERIPAALRPDFLAAAEEATAWERNVAETAEAKAFDELKARGVVVSETDAAYFRAAVKPVWTEFAAKYPVAAEVLRQIEAGSK
jgi:tripartite ATP-independent transporter DctP family solute receptor